MSSNRGRPRRLESAISICMIVALFLVGAVIFIKQFSYDMARFGIQPVPAAEPVEVKLGSLVPAGFEALSKMETYESGNLYEKINGKAPFYIESGFEKLFTQRFVDKEDENLWFELYIYDMAAVRNAFSVYSAQRRPDADILSLFNPLFGYRTINGLFFCHGNYYIELVGSAESKELFKAIIAIAQKIEMNLAVDDDTQIEELALFPEENLVPGSIKLYLSNAFGFAGLTDTFAARYKFGDETITAFLSKRSSAVEAGKVLEEYYEFLLDNGGKEIPTANQQTRFVDFYGTLEIISMTGPFVLGVHEAENRQLAEKVKEMLLNRLIKEIEVPKND